MTVKDIKELLNKFPDNAIVTTETNNHYTFDGIYYASLLETENRKYLILGNTNQLDGHEYNLRNVKINKTWNKFND
jgi:hypothetical protein